MRAESFRRLSEQHGLMVGDMKVLRDELQAAREEADSLRERAALVDALRAELAQFQNEVVQNDTTDAAPAEDMSAELAARDNEIAVLKAEIDTLRAELAAARDVPKPLPVAEFAGDMAALKAELAAACASRDEMQAFQSGVAARLEATMARLRQALDAQAQA
ncbi:MAG: hypothetical protein ACK4Z4_03475 [Ferrovibrio sp.]